MSGGRVEGEDQGGEDEQAGEWSNGFVSCIFRVSCHDFTIPFITYISLNSTIMQSPNVAGWHVVVHSSHPDRKLHTSCFGEPSVSKQWQSVTSIAPPFTPQSVRRTALGFAPG